MGTSPALSGSFGTPANSARAGYLPICLSRAPLGAFEGIPVYLRNTAGGGAEAFMLYCAEHVRLTTTHRDRLEQADIRFVYIPIARQAQFRRQTEDQLQQIVTDPGTATSVASEIVYETSVELVNELLRDPDLMACSPRLETVSRAVTTLVLKDPSAFSHLFAASHHDFYTATHMVNVATWMVPLAYAVGIEDATELNQICQAGMLHDIGKIYIPAEILNKKGRLEDAEWEVIRSHPDLGCKHMMRFPNVPEVVLTVMRQHHERIDGTGYPDRLTGEQIALTSRICAVADSFDAMTAFRPYKERTMTVSKALNVIVEETPSKYDPKVVAAWVKMLQSAERDGVLPESLKLNSPQEAQSNRRRSPRFTINCPGHVDIIELRDGAWQQRESLVVVAHSISRNGVGFLSQAVVKPGEHLRLHLRGEGTLNRMEEGVAVRCRAYRDGWYEIGVDFAPVAAQFAPIPLDLKVA